MKNKTLKGQFARWIDTLRNKAELYELETPHSTGRPTLDDLCNEMEAFINGYQTATELIE